MSFVALSPVSLSKAPAVLLTLASEAASLATLENPLTQLIIVLSSYQFPTPSPFSTSHPSSTHRFEIQCQIPERVNISLWFYPPWKSWFRSEIKVLGPRHISAYLISLYNRTIDGIKRNINLICGRVIYPTQLPTGEGPPAGEPSIWCPIGDNCHRTRWHDVKGRPRRRGATTCRHGNNRRDQSVYLCLT